MIAPFVFIALTVNGAMPLQTGASSPSSGSSLVQRQLPNGMTAMVCVRPSRGLAAVDIWVRAGSAYEGEGERGAAHFLEHLLFKGTTRRKPGEIDAEIERMGGLLNAGTTRDAAHLFAVVPAERVADALDVMQDALFNSLLAEDQVELERRVILDELARADDDAGQRIADAAFQLSWSSHPYARSVLSQADEIAAITRESILAFYRRLYRPERMAVVVAGDVDPEAMLRTIVRVFGSQEAVRSAANELSVAAASPRSGPALLRQPNARPMLAVWSWAARTPETGTSAKGAVSDAVVADLTAEVLCDAVSRSPGTAPVMGEAVGLRQGALVYLWSEVPQAGIQATDSAIEAVMRRLAREGPSGQEIEAARRRLLGRRLYRVETAQGFAREIGMWWTLGDANLALDMPERLRALTAADVGAFVKRCLEPPTLGGERPEP